MVEDGGKVVTQLVLDDRTTIGLKNLSIGMKNFALTGQKAAGNVSSAWSTAGASVAGSANLMGKSFASLGAIAKTQGLHLTGSLQTIGKSFTDFNAGLRRTSSQIGGMGIGLAEWNKKLTFSNSQLRNVTQTANTFGRQFSTVSGLINTTGANFEKAGASSSVFGKKLTKVSSNVQAVSNSLGGLGTWLRRVTSALGVLATFMAIRMVGSIVVFSAEFEAGITKIVALVGVAREKVESWGESIKLMAYSSGRSVNELVDAMFYITSAGLRGAESLQVLSQVAMGSAAGLGEMGSIARTVVSAMNAWGKENLSAAQATGTLFATVREGNIQTEELAGTFSKVIPIAASLGINMGQLGGALALVTRDGMDAAKATTGLRRLMLALAKPSKQAEEALNDVGLSSEFLREVMAGPNGLQEAMEYLAIATENSFEKISAAIPNIRALGPALTLARKGTEEFRDVFASVDADQTKTVLEGFVEGAGTMQRSIDKMAGGWSQFKEAVGDSSAAQAVVDFFGEALSNAAANIESIGAAVDKNKIDDLTGGFVRAVRAADSIAEAVIFYRRELIAAGKAGYDVTQVHKVFAQKLMAASNVSKEFKSALSGVVSELLGERQALIDAAKATNLKNEEEKLAAIAVNEERIALKKLNEEKAEQAVKDEKARKALKKKNDESARQALIDGKYIITSKLATVAIKTRTKETDNLTAGLKLFGSIIKRVALGEISVKDAISATVEARKESVKELKEDNKEKEKEIKLLEKEEDAIDNLVYRFVDFAREKGALNGEIEETTDAMADEVVALRETGASFITVEGRIAALKLELKELEQELGVNSDEFSDYAKAIRKAGEAIEEVFTGQNESAIIAAFTGNFDNLIDSFSTLGEDLAAAFAEAFTATSNIGIAESFKNFTEGKFYEKHKKAFMAMGKGLAAASTAYGIYQGAQEGTVGVGEGALSGAATGFAIGGGVGAIVGAIAGAAIAYFGQADPDKLMLSYSGNRGAVSGTNVVSTSGISDADAAKVAQDVDLAIRKMKASFFDLAEAVGSVDLFAELSDVFKDIRIALGRETGDIASLISDIFTNVLPKAMLNQVASTFIGAFDDLGFGAVMSAAFSQAMEMSGDAAADFLMNVARGVLALNDAMKDLDFESLIEQLSMTQMETFEKFMTESLADIELIQQRMAGEFDAEGLAGDAERIAALINEAREAELQMLSQIKQMQESINANWDAMFRQTELAGLGPAGSTEIFANDLAESLALLQGATSPEEIQQYSGSMQAAIQSLMGLIGEDDWNDRWQDVASGIRDPLGDLFGGAAWQDIFDATGFDFDSFEGTTREAFQAIITAMKEQTDAAFGGATDRVAAWADAIEQAALDTAAALNDLAAVMGEWVVTATDPVVPIIDAPPIIDPIALDLMNADNAIQNGILESSRMTNTLMSDFINTPPVVEINIDGTLEPLIALIDMRIQTAGAGGGP